MPIIRTEKEEGDTATISTSAANAAAERATTAVLQCQMLALRYIVTKFFVTQLCVTM